MGAAGDVRYRLARPRDALAIGVLARPLTRQWILPEQPLHAAARLLDGMRARVVRGKILVGQRLYLAWLDGRLVGVAAMRDDRHLFQLFVSTRLQRRGIAGQLWQCTRRDAVRRAGTRRFPLNASVAAVPVCRRFGFVPGGPRTISPSGVVTQPMHLDRH